MILRGDEVFDLRARIRPTRIEEEAWFLKAVSLAAEPFAVVPSGGGPPLFGWEYYGLGELLGGGFVDGAPWPWEADAAEIVEQLPPGTYGGFTNMPNVECEQVRHGTTWLPIDSSWLPASDFHEGSFANVSWSSHRRKNFRKEMHALSSLRVSWGDVLSVADYFWLVGQTVRAAAKDAHEEYRRTNYAKAITRAAHWNLMLEASKRGILTVIRATDAGKLVGCAVYVTDALRNSATLHLCNVDPEYPSLGKLLYWRFVNAGIRARLCGLSAGVGLVPIKEHFRFVESSSWVVVV